MYVLLTIGALYYREPLLTFSSHSDAYAYALKHCRGWFDIEAIYGEDSGNPT